MSTDTLVPAASVAGSVADVVIFPTLDPSGESEGYTRGHAAGYAAGLRRAAAELAAREADLVARHEAASAAERARTDRAVTVLGAAARALELRTAPVLAAADTALVTAALDLAEMVLGCELSDAPHAAGAALKRALSTPEVSALVAVRLHPDDVALVRDSVDAAQVTLVADDTLARGDAVAVFPDGELDARIAAAVSRARTALAGGEA